MQYQRCPLKNLFFFLITFWRFWLNTSFMKLANASRNPRKGPFFFTAALPGAAFDARSAYFSSCSFHASDENNAEDIWLIKHLRSLWLKTLVTVQKFFTWNNKKSLFTNPIINLGIRNETAALSVVLWFVRKKGGGETSKLRRDYRLTMESSQRNNAASEQTRKRGESLVWHGNFLFF